MLSLIASCLHGEDVSELTTYECKASALAYAQGEAGGHAILLSP